ncbi:MAG: MarR family transcriptional regulator [Cyanobacteria bacterium]|nr:MarR family transcriptional regulator [Cyanobacteriota bacterium]MDA0867553.1 MarR family transcriptional regulator [Cyanobacteriota bacterium]
MDDARTLNLLGAFALSVGDALQATTSASTGYGGEAPAALVSLGAEPGISINTLRYILQLSHPGTVRLVDRLEAQGWVERRSGPDGRTRSLFLTTLGQERRQTILLERRQPLQVALSALSERDLQQLTPLLEKMLIAMTTTEQQGLAICRLCEEEVCPSDLCPVEQRYRHLVQP